ncbi:MAG: DUF2255 family protein [Nocardioidaceae bacterium]
MTEAWSPHELEQIHAAAELHIAVRRTDGTLHRWTPIWVVSADGQAYVRTWYRRDTGWFGHAQRSRRARIRVPGLESDAAVEDVGEGTAGLRERIDTAYRNKYGSSGSSSMVGATAAATTLRLSPEPKTGPDR